MSTNYKSKKISPLLWLIVFIIPCFYSCDESAKIENDQKIMIDTLSNNEIMLLAPELDSMCIAHFDSLVLISVDSIKRIREEQVLKKLLEIKNKKMQ